MLAAILDDLDLPEVKGTLAGHDVIIIISADEIEAQKMYDLFIKHMNEDLVE